MTSLMLLISVVLLAAGQISCYRYRHYYPSYAAMSDIDWGKRSGGGKYDNFYAGMSDIDWGKRSGGAGLRDNNWIAGMSDIDWSKRSAYRDNWISPAYEYASMADYDWGWKKRGGQEDNDVKRAGWNGARNNYWPTYRYPKYYPRPAEPQTPQAPQALASRTSSYRPAISSPIRANRAMNYVSMADLDWGRRKRMLNGLWKGLEQEPEQELAEEDEPQMEKKHVGSLGGSLRGKQRY